MSNERVKTIKERKVEEKITVRMTDTYLFDFTLYHTYSKLTGFLTNILVAAIAFMGIIMLVMGKIKPVQIIFYLVAAVVTNSLLVGNELAARSLRIRRSAKSISEKQSMNRFHL